MSITIRHPAGGPLKGDQSFGEDFDTILIGRGTDAQVVYPEECIAVDGEHLRLNREADGGYTIELCGSCDVEVDGRPAETGDPVTSGNVVTVGMGGPSFEVLLPGVTIKHLEGPLAGKQQFFGETKEEIAFARLPGQGDVTYPASCKIVGKQHFSLKRNPYGDYAVQLTPNHYVQIGEMPADSGAFVPKSGVIRLGNATGPTFSVAVGKPAAAGEVTDENIYVAPVRQELGETDAKLDRARRLGGYALGGLAAALCAVVVYGVIRDFQHSSEVRQLSADLASADYRLTELAENTIPKFAQDSLQQAVYLVAKVQGGKDVGQATAWAFEDTMLATNAHVTSQIKGHEADWVLIGPNEERIPIKDVSTHPGYAKFKAYLKTVGGTAEGKFKQLDVINEYDVGIIYTADPLPPDPDTGKIVTLERAPEDYVEKLAPGAAVAAIGFPIEGMTATMVVTDAPATLHFGNISSLTDVFMCRAKLGDDRLLIQHTVPVTGGMSGSPLIDKSGMVIGVVSGGNTASVVKEVTVTKDKSPSEDGEKPKEKMNIEIEGIRVPSAALVNFAQRIDLLEDLRDGEVELSDDQNYWKDAAKKFVSVFADTDKNFVAFVEDSLRVTEPNRQEIGSGTLKPRKAGAASFDSKTHSFELEPGHVYGFIANSKSGIPIALNVKKQGTSDFLGAKADTQQAPGMAQAPGSGLAPTVWVTVDAKTQVDVNVFSMIADPADYDLYVYDWVKPAEAPTADTSSEEQ